METLRSALLLGLGFYLLEKCKIGLGARIAAALAAFMFMSFSAAYYASNAITGKGIDEAAFFYVMYGLEGAGFGAYTGVIVKSLLLLGAGLFAAHLVFKHLSPGNPTRGRSGVIVGFAALAAALLVHPLAADISKLTLANWFLKQSPISDFYRSPRVGTAEGSRPNLVFIYAESLERTYFDEARFPGLITGLRDLEKNALTFTGIEQVEGTGWTIAGVTASQCGIPLVTTGAGGNSMGNLDQFLPGASCLGDQMKALGYRLSFMGGASLEFGGKGKFYSSHGFEEVQGREELSASLPDPDYESDWGLYDDSLFDLAFEKYKALSSSKENFGLFLLTLDTHHPDGHQSQACRGVPYQDGSIPMLNAVSCSDRVISRFVNRVLKSDYAANTVVVVASDHLAIYNGASELLNQKGERNRRNLFLALGGGIEPGVVERRGATLDIGPTVMKLLGFDVAALGLGRSLLDPAPTLLETFKTAGAMSEAIRGWTDDLVRFWDMPSIKEALEIDPDGKTARLDDRAVKLPVLIEFEAGLKTKKLMFPEFFEPVLWGYASRLKLGAPFLWIDKCRNVRVLDESLPAEGLCLYAGSMGGPERLAEPIELPVRIPVENLAKAMTGAPSAAAYQALKDRFALGTTDIRELPLLLTDGNRRDILIKSVGFPGVSSEIAADGSSRPLLFPDAGLSLIGLGKDNSLKVLANINPFLGDRPPAPLEPFIRLIREKQQEFPAFLVMVHESAFIKPMDLSPLFQDLPLEKWKTLNFRQPYIGLLAPDSSLIEEYIGEPETTLALRLHFGIKQAMN
ncbi:MAG: sulfatase-like hydrolase/transferase [Pseudomonadota bacterium]